MYPRPRKQAFTRSETHRSLAHSSLLNQPTRIHHCHTRAAAGGALIIILASPISSLHTDTHTYPFSRSNRLLGEKSYKTYKRARLSFFGSMGIPRSCAGVRDFGAGELLFRFFFSPRGAGEFFRVYNLYVCICIYM